MRNEKAADPTWEYVKEYCRKRCLMIISVELYNEMVRRLNAINRWIPVSEGLPKEIDSIFAKFKGTPEWKSGMWEKRSDHVFVTVMLEDGFTAVDVACTRDGEWVFDQYSVALRPRKVLAWRPFPAAYKSEEV